MIIYNLIVYIMNTIDLTDFGLTPNQSLLYQKWLQHGTRQVTALARFAGMHRVLAYNTLQELCKMGLATCIERSWTGYYSMVDPMALQEKLQDKVKNFTSILPSLQQIIKQWWWSFHVQFFMWIEWLKTLYDLVPNSKTNLKAFLGADHIEPEFRDYLYKVYLPKRLSRGLRSKAIVSQTDYNQEFADNEVVPQTEVLIVPDALFDMSSEIILFDDDKILIASMSETEMSWIMIHSKNLYTTLENIFDLIWRMYKK